MPKRENNDEANVLNGYSAFLRNKCNCNNSKLQKCNVQQKKKKRESGIFFCKPWFASFKQNLAMAMKEHIGPGKNMK